MVVLRLKRLLPRRCWSGSRRESQQFRAPLTNRFLKRILSSGGCSRKLMPNVTCRYSVLSYCREGLGVICAFQTSVLSLVCSAQNAHAPLTNLYLNFLCLKTIVFNFCGVVGPLQPSVPAHASLQLSHLRHRAHSRHLLPLHRHRLQQQHCHHNTLSRHRQYPAASAHVRQNVSASPKSAPNQSILFKYCVLHFPPFCC